MNGGPTRRGPPGGGKMLHSHEAVDGPIAGALTSEQPSFGGEKAWRGTRDRRGACRNSRVTHGHRWWHGADGAERILCRWARQGQNTPSAQIYCTPVHNNSGERQSHLLLFWGDTSLAECPLPGHPQVSWGCYSSGAVISVVPAAPAALTPLACLAASAACPSFGAPAPSMPFVMAAKSAKWGVVGPLGFSSR